MAVRLLGDTYGLERGFANLCEVYPYAIKWQDEEITVSQLPVNSECDLEIYRHEGKLCVFYRRQCDFFRGRSGQHPLCM